MTRWFNGMLRRRQYSHESNDIPNINHQVLEECYTCTQFGVPVFHSTTCDPSHRPHWEALAGSSLIPIKNHPDRQKSQYSRSLQHGVLDPLSDTVRWWNRVILLARAIALAVDPLFFLALSFVGGGDRPPCVRLDSGVAAVIGVVRTCVDAVHLSHVWLQFRLAYVSRETLVVGCGKLVWDPRVIASHYLRCLRGFWFDAFVLLPVPQVSCFDL